MSCGCEGARLEWWKCCAGAKASFLSHWISSWQTARPQAFGTKVQASFSRSTQLHLKPSPSTTAAQNEGGLWDERPETVGTWGEPQVNSLRSSFQGYREQTSRGKRCRSQHCWEELHLWPLPGRQSHAFLLTVNHLPITAIIRSTAAAAGPAVGMTS